jgi:hypothetical protein
MLLTSEKPSLLFVVVPQKRITKGQLEEEASTLLATKDAKAVLPEPDLPTMAREIL